MDRPSQMFKLEQYRLLRQSVDLEQKKRDDLTRFTLVGNALFMAWIFSEPRVLPPAAYALPLMFTSAMAWSWWVVRKGVRRLGRFLRGVERDFGMTEKSGWELFVESERQPGAVDLLRRRETPIWIGMLAYSLAYLLTVGFTGWIGDM